MEKCCVPSCQREVDYPQILCFRHFQSLSSPDRHIVAKRIYSYEDRAGAQAWAVDALAKVGIR